MWFLSAIAYYKCANYELSYCETFRTLVDRGLHALTAIFRPTFDRDPSTISFNMLKLTILYNSKLLQHVAKMSPIGESLSDGALNIP